MVTIQTHAYAGEDGVLRFEIPTKEKNRDVQVTLLIGGPERDDAQDDPLAELRARLAGRPDSALTLPPPGRPAYVPFKANELPGPPASEMLIRDRR